MLAQPKNDGEGVGEKGAEGTGISSGNHCFLFA
jgi:hypothetical protein